MIATSIFIKMVTLSVSGSLVMFAANIFMHNPSLVIERNYSFPSLNLFFDYQTIFTAILSFNVVDLLGL